MAHGNLNGGGTSPSFNTNILSLSNPTKINGIAVANISKVNGI